MAAKYVVMSTTLMVLEGEDTVVKERGDILDLDPNAAATKRYLELGGIQAESGPDKPADPPPAPRRGRAAKE